MFRRHLFKTRETANKPDSFYWTKFRDPVAKKTQWIPLKRGGKNLRSRKLMRLDAARLALQTTIHERALFLFMMLLGWLIILVMGKAYLTLDEIGFTDYPVTAFVLGVILTLVGGSMLYFKTTPRIFNKSLRVFQCGRKKPHVAFVETRSKHLIPFVEIHALQLISEFCTGSSSGHRGNETAGGFYSYELNLVLIDGTRVNLMDHGELERLREDAETLSGFLDKPIWDGI